ncbi:MAG: U32 family peptidase [Bacilli bacterium]|jgi:putative protease
MTRIIVDVNAASSPAGLACDGFVFADPDFSLHPVAPASRGDIATRVRECKDKGLLAIVNVDKIVDENELDDLDESLAFYTGLGVDYFLYGDYAVLAWYLENKPPVRLIYDPKTLVTNYRDAEIHREWEGLVAVSNEVSRGDMERIVAPGNAVLEVYGHRRIFYSRRPLLTAYGDYSGANFRTGVPYQIREETRSGGNIIYESKHCSLIFTGYRIAIFRELLAFSQLPRFIRINGAFIPEEELAAVTALYRGLLNEPDRAGELYLELARIYPDLKAGYRSDEILPGGEAL